MATMTKEEIASEYEKTKANLGLLENLLQQEKQKEFQEQVTSESKAEVKDISKKFNAAKTELDDKQATLDKTVEEHATKVGEWKQNSINLEGILFKDEVPSVTSSDNDDDLERAAELAQLNAVLLNQKLAIRQQLSAAKIKRTNFKSLQNTISAKDEMHRTLDVQLTKLDEQIATGCQKYQQNLESQLKAITGHMGTKTEDSFTSCEKERAQAYNEGRLSASRLLLPLADAGQSVRGRKLEWEKNTTKNQALVQRGNKAAHYGMALADASLYQNFYPEPRTDSDTFIEIYGVHPDFVWENQNCKACLNILDWRGGMKDYRTSPNYRSTYSLSNFHALSKDFFIQLKADSSSWKVANLNQYLQDDVKGSMMYKNLKEEHDSTLAKHKVYLQNR